MIRKIDSFFRVRGCLIYAVLVLIHRIVFAHVINLVTVIYWHFFRVVI